MMMYYHRIPVSEHRSSHLWMSYLHNSPLANAHILSASLTYLASPPSASILYTLFLPPHCLTSHIISSPLLYNSMDSATESERSRESRCTEQPQGIQAYQSTITRGRGRRESSYLPPARTTDVRMLTERVERQSMDFKRDFCMGRART